MGVGEIKKVTEERVLSRSGGHTELGLLYQGGRSLGWQTLWCTRLEATA